MPFRALTCACLAATRGQVYNNEDPLDVYRTEGLTLFDSMQTAVRQNTMYSFLMYKPTQ